MSLPKIDYRMPITIPVIAIHAHTRDQRVIHVDVLWSHVLAIEDEPFPEQFIKEITDKYNGVCTIRLAYATYIVAGPFRHYHSAWCAYKRWSINEENKFKFQLPAN